MLPELFIKRMQEMLQEEFDAFDRSYDLPQQKALRLNTLKSDSDRLQAKWPLTPVAWADHGYRYDETPDFRPGLHPYHDAGVYYIQEPSAMAPVSYLDIKEGDIVLDLCAAPGGKSTQIAAVLDGTGLLVANEYVANRSKILSENIERMGVRNAIVTNETPQRLSAAFPLFFNKILVDAPCSGEGMFRKNDDAVGEWSPENVALCADRQDEILDEAAKMLTDGGTLVYSTCTFAPEEDEGTITRFLARHPQFHLVEAPLFEGADRGRSDWYPDAPTDIDKTIRLFPHHLRGEGHYLAVLKKDGNPKEQPPVVRKKKVKKIDPVIESFLRDTLADHYSGLFTEQNGALVPATGLRIEAFGDQIYLVPEQATLKGLKVVRPGLHIGTIKKNRFDPSHALALALHTDEVKRFVDLPAVSTEVFSGNEYRKGLTFSHEGENGWYLITVDGYSIGWGKLASQIMKNHYPKGLRR